MIAFLKSSSGVIVPPAKITARACCVISVNTSAGFKSMYFRVRNAWGVDLSVDTTILPSGLAFVSDIRNASIFWRVPRSLTSDYWWLR